MTAVFLTSCYGVLSATAGGDAVLLPPAPLAGPLVEAGSIFCADAMGFFDSAVGCSCCFVNRVGRMAVWRVDF